MPDVKARFATIDELLVRDEDVDEACVKSALQLLDWRQQSADLWRGSNNANQRKILDAVSLNRMLSDVSLVTEKRKPFDQLAKRLEIDNSRADNQDFEQFRPSVEEFVQAILETPFALLNVYAELNAEAEKMMAN